MKFPIILFLLSFVLFPLTSQASLPEPNALEILKNLIAIDTTNPPGNEIEAMNYVGRFLSGYGISSKLIETAPGRGNLVARIPGSGSKKPILFLAHLDVVTADPTEWNSPPFSPTEKDGYLYGRGAIDMKGMAAIMISTFSRVQHEGIKLDRDLILLLVADEEAGGKYGAEYMVKNYLPDWDPGMVFGEGSIGLQKDGFHLYPIQVAEKGVAWLRLTATGTSGHGSMPIPDNATEKLLKALNRIITTPQPIQKTKIVQVLLDRLAEHFSFPKSFFLRHFFDFPIRQLAPLLAGSRLESDKIFNSMVKNTVVPTVLKAGSMTNVIPAKAMAELDCRILPGETPEGFRRKIIDLMDDPKIKVDLIAQSLPNESSFESIYFQALESAIKQTDPKAIVIPFISPGATDNRFFREKGILAYGLIPFLITTKDLEGLHGKNERVSIREITRGEKILMIFLKNL